ncbi:uncharacterized protein [Rutidosis leptorrhynchoides]|uniref:uncharacterized protein n=1 Tax=Rutidosis leptorrhynchoides TaxID=125765 RepID=UPI003A9A39A6
MHDSFYKQDKFGKKGRPCVFIGYPMGQKGYKLYDLKSEKIHVSGNVTFIEDCFPFDPNYNGHKSINKHHLEEALPNIQELLDNSMEENNLEENLNNGHNSNDHFENLDNNQENHQINDDASDEEQSEVAETSQNNQTNNDHDVLRQSTRHRSTPKHLDEFVVDLPPSIASKSTTTYPLPKYVSYDRFSKPHRAYLASITSHNEPKTFEQAKQSKEWCETMKKEIKALEENETWIIQNLPPGKRAIESK